MQKLELTPPLLIITMGYPGAGKTYFARQFADEYSLSRISEERIRFELFESPTFSAEESDIIDRITKHMLEESMKTQQVLVFDGLLLTLAERRRVYELARQNKYRTITVWLQTDADTAMTRSTRRDKRRPDNKYAATISPETFKQLQGRLERPHEKEVAVVVSGKHAFRSQVNTVLRKIAAIYSSGLSQRATPQLQRTMPPRTAGADRRIIQ